MPQTGQEPPVVPPDVERSNGPGSRVTIRNVAQRAGVSISTVSHTYSGLRPISDATRERVLTAARELGYNANPAARSLRTGRSGLIGLILRPRDAVHGSVGGTETFNRLSGAVATAVLNRGLGLVQVPSGVDPGGAGVPMDGCIVAHPYGSDEVVSDLTRRGVPIVTVEEDPDRPELGWSIRLDHAGVVRELLEALSAQGARRVLLLTGTEDNAWNRRSRQTYQQWAHERGLEDWHLALYEGEGVTGGARLIEPILTSGRPPDAVVAASSRFAAGIVQSAQRLGVTVPDDLMVAALTDSEHSRASDPPITGTDLMLEDLGTQAVELLLRRLAGEPEPDEVTVLRPVLRWRDSTSRDGTHARDH